MKNAREQKEQSTYVRRVDERKNFNNNPQRRDADRHYNDTITVRLSQCENRH